MIFWTVEFELYMHLDCWIVVSSIQKPWWCCICNFICTLRCPQSITHQGICLIPFQSIILTFFLNHSINHISWNLGWRSGFTSSTYYLNKNQSSLNCRYWKNWMSRLDWIIGLEIGLDWRLELDWSLQFKKLWKLKKTKSMERQRNLVTNVSPGVMENGHFQIIHAISTSLT